MKGFVLCAIFLILGGKQTYGAEVNLDFLKDPDFPGNAGFNAKLNSYVKDTVDNAMQPANSYSGNTYTGYTGNYPGSNVVYEGPNLSHIRIPHAPQNFPFPPDCTAVSDPGYKFPDASNNNNNNYYNGNKIEMKVTGHKSFECTDPEYGQDSFYMQMTEYSYNTNFGINRMAAYYDKTGKKINYSRKMVMLPLGESLPASPRNDYLGMDVTY